MMPAMHSRDCCQAVTDRDLSFPLGEELVARGILAFGQKIKLS